MNVNPNDTVVIGVFHDREQADRAVAELRRSGFSNDQIGVMARDTAAAEAGEAGSKWEEGAVTGAVAGAGVGGLVGLGILAGVIPAIGPVVAGGTLAVILANAAGGAAIAGVLGALIGMGIPEEEAGYYEDQFQAGRTIVTVKPEGRALDAMAILNRFGSYDRKTAPRPAGESPAVQPAVRVPVHSDELEGADVGKTGTPDHGPKA